MQKSFKIHVYLILLHKHIMIIRNILLISLSLTYGSALAINDEGKACMNISDDNARLACFDRVYTPDYLQDSSPKSIDLDRTIETSKQQKSTQIVFAEQLHSDTELAQNLTPLSRMFDLDRNNGILSLREHEPIYLMPAWYRTSPNYTPSSPTRGTAINDVYTEQKRLEAKLQISLKTKVMEDLFGTRADLWAAYTQQSNWQLYNQGEKSAPFRNTDYMPEIMLTQPVKMALPFNGKLRMLGVGYIHQSNGQARPLSRSWNRIYATAGMEWGKLTVVPRVWMRIADPDGDKDDNPDIMKYMGYGDLRLAYHFDDKHILSSTLRYNPIHNRGAIQVNYMFPIKGRLKAYVQGFHGYGESLIDYNHKQTGIGVGITFNGWDAL